MGPVSLVADTLPVVTRNNIHDDISYSSGWIEVGARWVGDLDNDVRYATTVGDSFEIVFEGTGIEYITPRAASNADIAITIDGVEQETVRTGSANYAPQQTVFGVYDLSDGPHTLRGEQSSAGYANVDGWTVFQGGASRLNDDDDAFAYQSGAWYPSPHRGIGDHLDDVYYATSDGAWFELTFDGTGVALMAPTCSTCGHFEVSIDGVAVGTTTASGFHPHDDPTSGW